MTKYLGFLWRSVFVALTLSVVTAPSKSKAGSQAASTNPDLSVNALMLYQNSSRGNSSATSADPKATENGLSLQETELQFVSDVDPFWRLNVLLSIHQEKSADGTSVKREWKIEPEEAYAETLSVPTTTLHLGKLKAAIGRHNLLHPHAYPFIDQPLVNAYFLGDEGFNDTGAAASFLLPIERWFSEVTLQFFSGRSDAVSTYFGNTSPNAMVTVAHLKNLWDLGSETTLEWGLSGASGKNSYEKDTGFFGTDLTVKWRPSLFGATRAVIWSFEALTRSLAQTVSTENGKGAWTGLQFQLQKTWWLEARTEYAERIGILDSSTSTTSDLYARKNSVLIGYVPTEFSAVRLQYDILNDQQKTAEQKLSVQFNYSIGAHPAHLY